MSGNAGRQRPAIGTFDDGFEGLGPSHVFQENQSRKLTPHRTARSSARESPLPELNEKMSLQAGQISNLQQNFGSIQQEIKKVEESIMRLSTTLGPTESFHGHGRLVGAPLRRSFEDGNFNIPNHMIPLRGSYQDYPNGGRMSFEESGHYGSFSPARIPAPPAPVAGEVMTPSLKFAMQRIQDLHLSLQSDHHAAINELARRRAQLEERTRALQACDASYFAAGQGSDAWLRAAEEGLHLRSDIELNRKEVELANERFHHVDERLKLVQSTLSSIQDTASRAQSAGDLKSHESARQTIAAACSRLGVVVQEEPAPIVQPQVHNFHPNQGHPQNNHPDLRASLVFGEAAASNFFMSPAEEERTLHAQVTALNIEIDSIRRFARSKASSPFAHDQDAARRSDAEVQVRQDRVRQLEARLAQLKHDKPSSIELTGQSLEDDLRARISEKEAEIETVNHYLQLLSKSGRASDMTVIHAAQRDLAIKRAELAGLQTALNLPAVAVQVQEFDPVVNQNKLPSRTEGSPAAQILHSVSPGVQSQVRRLSPSDVAKLGQELRDIQGEIASMRRWAAAKRRSDSAVEQEAAARAEDAIALKETRCEEIRELLKPHEAKLEAEARIDSAAQNAEKEQAAQMLKDLQAQLDLKNNEIEGLRAFARKKRQSVIPGDQQIASKAERAIKEREAEIQVLQKSALELQSQSPRPELSRQEKRAKRLQVVKAIVRTAQEGKLARMQEEVASSKKETTHTKVVSTLKVASSKSKVALLQQEKSQITADYENKLELERSRFESERILFEQTRAEMEERTNRIKREADELVEKVRADGYEVLQQQRLEFEAQAAEFRAREEAALEEVTRLNATARMKRKSLAPNDIMEANRLEDQARMIRANLEDERSAQAQNFEVVKQASETLKDIVSNEQFQIVSQVETESTQLDLMKKFVANKRKSVIPADQLAADQAQSKVNEKEAQMMNIMNTVAQQQSQVDFLIQTIQILAQNAASSKLIVDGAAPQKQLSPAQLDQQSELQARIDQLNEELESVKEQHAAMMGFYNVKASSSKESEQLAAEALLSAIQTKTEEIQNIETEIEECEQALQAIASNPEGEISDQQQHKQHSGVSMSKSASDRSFEEQQEEVRLLRQKLEEEEKAMEKMQKWVAHKRKSVLPADLKAADKAAEELSKADVRVKALRKSISGKLMMKEHQEKPKKKGIRFAGDDGEDEQGDEDVHISDESAEKIRAMEAEIAQLKKWVSSKRASVLPTDQQAAAQAEQKIKARVAELAKIKEEADKELAELLRVKSASVGLEKENAEHALEQLQEQRQESEAKLQSLEKVVGQMHKFAQGKRKSVLPVDIEAAEQAEAVIASKTAEVQALEEKIARSHAMEAELSSKASAAEERMRILEEKLENQEKHFEERMQTMFSKKAEVLEPMVALPTDDPEALQRIALLLRDQSSALRKSEIKKRQSVVSSDLREADSLARNISDLERQEAQIKDAMSKLRSQQYSDYSSSASNQDPRIQAKRAEEVALRAHIENMRSWMVQKEQEQGNSSGLEIIRDTLQAKEQELADLQEELLILSGADMSKITSLRQELQMLRNPNLLLQSQEAQVEADTQLLAQNQEKIRAASLFISNKRKSVFPADHAQADDAESKLKSLQQQVELQRAHLESQQAEMLKVRNLIERMQNPQFGHDEDELIDQGLAEARERTEQEIDNMKAEIRQRRKSTFPADIARVEELEQLLVVKEREQEELEERRRQHQSEVENEREQARQQAQRQQARIAKLESMLSGIGELDLAEEASNSELQAQISALSSEISLMQKWIQSKESSTDASVLQPARDMLQTKIEELQSLEEQLDRNASRAHKGMSLDQYQKFSFEIDHETNASIYPIGHSAYQQLLAQHDEALQNLSSHPVPLSVPGLESALFLAKEALPTKVSELQQLVLDARRLLCEREQKWQGREDAHNSVKRLQGQLLQQLNVVAEKTLMYRGDACIAVGKYRERAHYLESRCQRVEISLEEQHAKVEKQRSKVRELMKRLGGQNGRSQQDSIAVEQALAKKEKYKSDLTSATSELNDLRDKVVELEANLETSQTEILHARNDHERSTLDFNRLASDCNQLRSALEGCISHLSSHMRRSTSGSLSLTDVMSEMPFHPEDNDEWVPITAVCGDLLSQTKNILGLIHEASRSSYSAAAVNEHAGLQRVNQALDSKLKELDSTLAEKDNALKTAETHLAQAVEGLHAMQTASEAAIKHALSSKQREIDVLKDKLRNALDNLNTMKAWVVEQHRQLDEEKHALQVGLEEQKRELSGRIQEQQDEIESLKDKMKSKHDELFTMTKKLRSFREKIVQMNWKDQSSRLLSNRKTQVLAEDSEDDEYASPSQALPGKGSSESVSRSQMSPEPPLSERSNITDT